MRRGPWLLATTVAVSLSSSARAQPAPTPATPAVAEVTAPVPEENASYPPPPPTGVYRRFSLSVAAGPGLLVGPGERTMAISHNVLRASWGLARNLSLFVSIEGARAPSVNPRTHDTSWLRHETFALGIQHHFTQQAYLRGSAGVGLVGEETATRSFSGGRGVAFTAALGYELAQLPRGAFALELAGNLTRYPTEYWGTAGLNLVVSLF